MDSLGAGNKYECPVCMEFLHPPIYQCYQGHMLCHDCESEIQTCPICRDDLPKEKKIRNRTVEEIVENLDFECRKKDQGCLAVMKCREMEEHKWDCQFTELPLCAHLNLDCQDNQSQNSILNHLQSSHDVKGVNFDELKENQQESSPSSSLPSIVEISQSLSPSRVQRGKKPVWKPHYFILDKKIFFLTTSYDEIDNALTWTVCVLGNSKTADQFLARIKLIREDSPFNCLQWQGLVSELKEEGNLNEFNPTEEKSSGTVKFNLSLNTLTKISAFEAGKSSKGSLSKDGSDNVKDDDDEDDAISWKLELQIIDVKQIELEKDTGIAKSIILNTDITYKNQQEIHYHNHHPFDAASAPAMYPHEFEAGQDYNGHAHHQGHFHNQEFPLEHETCGQYEKEQNAHSHVQAQMQVHPVLNVHIPSVPGIPVHHAMSVNPPAQFRNPIHSQSQYHAHSHGSVTPATFGPQIPAQSQSQSHGQCQGHCQNHGHGHGQGHVPVHAGWSNASTASSLTLSHSPHDHRHHRRHHRRHHHEEHQVQAVPVPNSAPATGQPAVICIHDSRRHRRRRL